MLAKNVGRLVMGNLSPIILYLAKLCRDVPAVCEAWCAAANVSTTRKKKGGYTSGFGITLKVKWDS